MATEKINQNTIVTFKIALVSGAVVDVSLPYGLALLAIRNWTKSYETSEPGPRDILQVEQNGIGYHIAFKADQISGLSYNI